MNKGILVVAADMSFSRDMWPVLESEGYEIAIVSNAKEAMEKLESQRFDLLLTDLTVSAMEESGLLRGAKQVNPDIEVITVSSDRKVASVVYPIKTETISCPQGPMDDRFLLKAIHRLSDERQSAQANRFLLSDLEQKTGFCGIIAKSKRMLQIFGLIKRVAETDSTVFITGETGVGKELVAQAIHFTGARRKMPFVAVNCGALAETLLESELFGHEKGSFTGAFKTKVGKFESAHKGTLFLDEIGDISIAMQVKLLRALQERKVERVGGIHPIDVDVRVISATNQNIKKKISIHEFRIDLFYRLNVIPIHIPPLRERLEDIPLLVDFFMDRLNGSLNRNIARITPRAIKQLMDYHWPGNVRELENAIERAYITCDGSVIDRFTFPQHSENPVPVPSIDVTDVVNTDVPFSAARSRVLKNFEKTYLTEALKRYKGNISQTAQNTGINPRTLWRKLKEYDLDRTTFAERP